MITIGRAHPSDLTTVRDLIRRAGLPLDGLGQAPADVFVARSGAEVVGTAALERHGGHGLLRSLAVSEQHRGTGVGSRLAEAAEERARDLGLDGVYLLTDTAPAFFTGRGYVVIERDAAPEPVMVSVEWAVACGESAVPMVLR